MSEDSTLVQKVITTSKSAIIQEQINDKVIKMLIELPDGDQRLVAFDIPPENCSVEDLLLQVGIPREAEANVSLVEDPTVLQIHYIVEVQGMPANTENGTSSLSLQFSNNSNCSTSKIEVPKYVEGKLAVCPHCGFLSSTFHRCQRCKRKLPENVKSVFDNYATKETEKVSTKIDPVIMIDEQEFEGVPISINTEEIKTSGENMEEVAIPMDEEFESDSDETQNQEDENEDPSSLHLHTVLSCRTVRIGSYKYFPPEKVIITHQGLRLSVPSLEDKQKIVEVNIKFQDIIRVMIHFGRNLPVLFFITSTRTAAKIRQLLGMKSPKNPYYDPASRDVTQKRITLLPEKISDDANQILRELFALKLELLNMSEANEILVRASPKEPTKRTRRINPAYSPEQILIKDAPQKP